MFAKFFSLLAFVACISSLVTWANAIVPPKSPLMKHIQPLASQVKASDDKLLEICAKSTEKVIDVSKITLNAFELCICGAIATAVGDFVMHPIDTIKVMQQAGGGLTIIETAKAILAKSGPLGFYQGVVPYITADGLSGAVKFATFEISKVFVEARTAVRFHPIAQFVCAAGAMLACSVLLVPGEVLKTQMQGGVVTSLWGGIQSILKNDGVAGLYTGYFATLVRDIPYTMLELGLYENIKRVLRGVRGKKDLDATDELTAAAITGGITSFITTPLDVIKTKLMMGGQYAGVWDAFTK